MFVGLLSAASTDFCVVFIVTSDHFECPIYTEAIFFFIDCCIDTISFTLVTLVIVVVFGFVLANITAEFMCTFIIVSANGAGASVSCIIVLCPCTILTVTGFYSAFFVLTYCTFSCVLTVIIRCPFVKFVTICSDFSIGI